MSKYLDFEHKQVNRAALYDLVNAPYNIVVEQSDSNLQIALWLSDCEVSSFFSWNELSLLKHVDYAIENNISNMIEALNNA